MSPVASTIALVAVSTAASGAPPVGAPPARVLRGAPSARRTSPANEIGFPSASYAVVPMSVVPPPLLAGRPSPSGAVVSGGFGGASFAAS